MTTHNPLISLIRAKITIIIGGLNSRGEGWSESSAAHSIEPRLSLDMVNSLIREAYHAVHTIWRQRWTQLIILLFW